MRRFFVRPVLNFITLVRSVSTLFIGFFERISADQLRFGRMIASMTLIAGLFWQTLLIVPSQPAHASVTPSAASNLPPPEPYVINGADSGLAIPAILAAGIVPSATDYFKAFRMPEGLVLADGPSIGEKLTDTAISALAFVAPSLAMSMKKTKAEPAAPLFEPPPPPPAGTVTFDFDGDGKADVGRWHPTNT